ncbi:hypothetical protein MNBD_GAMMA12-2965 [hydrothermal vent metagenome]|uniref:Uncharacterized protein n=1 Tax=hydrothermal vent metagenome TaxID=652676 RepID=A0A3B0Y523_9ZZZZ
MVQSRSPCTGIFPILLAEHLDTQPDVQIVEAGFTSMFDGQSTNHWRMSTIDNQMNNNPGKAIINDVL